MKVIYVQIMIDYNFGWHESYFLQVLFVYQYLFCDADSTTTNKILEISHYNDELQGFPP
jgi:hypothetical protein